MPKEPRERPPRVPAVNPATTILVCVLSLSILGLTVLFSASVSLNHDPYFYLAKQLFWFVLSGTACFLVSRLNLEEARGYVWVFAIVCLLGLLLVLVPGVGIAVKGSRRWLGYGPVRLQISELAKLAMVFGLAHYLALHQTRMREFVRGCAVPLAWIALFSGLILLEPDFGTAALTFTLGVVLLFLAGARLHYLVSALAGAAGVLTVAVLHNPNRLARFTAFLDVEGNKSAGTYQLWQAIVAFAAGGVDGVGLGQGRQQNSFLPEVHTDFIFAVIGEELGLFFTLGVVALFTVIFVLPEDWIDANGLLDDLAKIVNFLERAAVKDQKSFQGLFGGLLAVVNAGVEMSICQGADLLGGVQVAVGLEQPGAGQWSR